LLGELVSQSRAPLGAVLEVRLTGREPEVVEEPADAFRALLDSASVLLQQ
jgi:hypothetical protein